MGSNERAPGEAPGWRGAWPFRPSGPPPGIPATLTVHLVSHTHWDREWYVPAEWFRRRLVVTVDRVLDLLDTDPGWSFVLDGQAIVVEDYLLARPAEAARLRRAVEAGRLAIGPWYVQPDSLLPSGESHVRNLLEGRLVCAAHGGASRVAYTPDSFGHPAWFPTLLAGFDLRAFVFWRGHGAERDSLPARWWWSAEDGARVVAWHLEGSYLAAATLEDDPEEAALRLRDLAAGLAVRSPAHVLVPNGIDHALPDPHTAAVAEALVAATGWTVRRTTLDAAVETAATEPPSATWSGPLVGARDANLLPGVWSSRLPAKLANRRLEAALWTAEHLGAVAALLGVDAEQPTLRRVRRSLLANQAHDTIGGCSVDAVHDEADGRSAAAELAAVVTSRYLGGRLAGAHPEHVAPWADEWDVAVWNPVPWARREVVRIPVEGWPALRIRAAGVERHPAHVASMDGEGFTVDGQPARVVDAADPARDRFAPEQRLVDVEAVVDLPPLGWARVRLGRGPAVADAEDTGRTLVGGGASVEVGADGTVTYEAGGRRWVGLLAVSDRGDRGDSYDRDLLDDGDRLRLVHVAVARRTHPSGGGALDVERRYAVPAGLDADRAARVADEVPLVVRTTLALAPSGRLDLDVTVLSDATDHVVALRLPLPGEIEHAVQYGTGRHAAVGSTERWVHGPAATDCHQGWLAGDGLLVLAPGLPEVEAAGGSVDVTVLRAVGWLSRPDLRTRPGRAGPAIPVPGAQVREVRARLGLLPDPGGAAARWRALAGFERPPVVTLAGAAPAVAPGGVVLAVGPDVVATAVKPADDGGGAVLRLWNPAAAPADAAVRTGSGLAARLTARPCRLDEQPLDGAPSVVLGDGAGPVLGPHEVLTVRLDPPGTGPGADVR